MYYLLWEPSFHGETSENFVLLKTDANEVIINEFIRDYFREYQVLLTSGDIITFDEKEIAVQSFTEDAINEWYHYKQVKETTEKEQNQAKFHYLTPWRTNVQQAEQALKQLDEEERLAIYKYVEPESVSKELIEAMRKMGYEKYKGKNGKARFRSMHHQQIRERVDQRRQLLKQDLQKKQETFRKIAKDYDRTHATRVYEPVKRYRRD